MILVTKQEKRRRWFPWLLIASPFLIGAAICVSLLVGVQQLPFQMVVDALFHYDRNNNAHNVIIALRLPRTLGAIFIGACLAISGALMQGITRNHLADPSIIGVLDGSAFAITISFIFFPGLSSWNLMLISFLGSTLGTLIVFGMASSIPNGFSPVRLAIIGVVTGAFFSSCSAILANYFTISQDISFWYNSRLDMINMDYLIPAMFFLVLGIILSLVISESVTILSLGEEIAIGLGQKTLLIKALAMLSVIILTGIAVALAGKIAFVGLIMPHIVRYLVGVSYKRIIPCSAILGSVFLVFSDIIARVINYPFETPIGVITAFIGVPFFLYLVYTRGGKKSV